MNKTILRVAAEPDEPYIEYHSKTDTWTGLFVVRLLAVCQELHIKCEIYRPDKNSSVSDEILTGVMGDVHSGLADLGLTTIGITAERFHHFDIFYSYIGRSYSIIIHEDNLVTVEATSHMTSVLRVLASYEVWAITLAFVVLFLILGVTFDKTYALTEPSVPATPLGQLCVNWALRLVGTGLGFQGVEDYEKSARSTDLPISKIGLCLTWQIYAVVFLSVLMSRLPVIFTFGSPQYLPFSTPKRLLDSNFTVYSTGTPIKILNASLSDYERALSEKIIHLPKWTGNDTEYELGILQVAKNGRNAIILNLEQGSMMGIAALTCSLIIAVDRVVSVPIASVLFAKNSTLTELFRKGYTFWTECGIGESDEHDLKMLKSIGIQKNTRHQPHDCPFRKISNIPALQSKSISIDRFSTIFLLMGCAFVFGILVLCAETVMKLLRPVETKRAQSVESRVGVLY